MRILRCSLIAIAFATLPLSGIAGNGDFDFIYRDSHESGVERAWRTFTLALRDPHVFTDVPPFGCLDFTDNPIPIAGISLNGEIASALVSDSNGDNNLDLNSLSAVDRFDLQGPGQMMSSIPGLCPPPAPPVACGSPLPLPTAVPASNASSQNCLGTIPGTTSGYSPGVTDVPPPCFVTDAATSSIMLGAIPVTLIDSRSAATWSMAGDFQTPGLLRGFISETDADQTLLPPDLPLIGGQPLSSLLPGGSGNCAAGDDRDLYQGELGWWFYFAFESEQIPFTATP